MATIPGTNAVHIGTAILDQIAGIDADDLSPETARMILGIRIGDAHQQRVTALSSRASEGALSPAEDEELEESIRVGDLLAILWSKARLALRRAGQEP